MGQEVLAKRKGPGNEFESKRTADASEVHSMAQCALDLITKVVLCWCCVILLLHLNNKNNVCKQ